MKKIGTLVLNQLAKKELSQRQMKEIQGGCGPCPCACCNAPSGTADNGEANCEQNKWSDGCADGAYSFC